MTPFGREPWGDLWTDRLWPEWPRYGGDEFIPVSNFYEKDGKFFLTAELPGVKREDIGIDIDSNVVTISGKRQSEKEEEGADYYLKESAYGSFSKSYRLPAEIEEDKVEATFKDGVLKVVMPHKEAPTRKKIEITEK